MVDGTKPATPAQFTAGTFDVLAIERNVARDNMTPRGAKPAVIEE